MQKGPTEMLQVSPSIAVSPQQPCTHPVPLVQATLWLVLLVPQPHASGAA
jgi:hypothetical protein